MKVEMTKEQFNVFYAIQEYIIEHGISPTIRELSAILGKSSPSTIVYHLKKLKKDGYIDYDEKKSRTIRIVKRDENEWKGTK